MAARKTARKTTRKPKRQPAKKATKRKPARKTKRKPARRPGRKTNLTKKVFEELCRFRALGVPVIHCAGAAGVSRRVVYHWLELGQRDIEDGNEDTLHARFFAEMEQACSRGVATRIRRINAQGRRDWRADAWYLERCEPAFREKSEVEVTERGAFGIDETALQHLTEQEITALRKKVDALSQLDAEIRGVIEEARGRA